MEGRTKYVLAFSVPTAIFYLLAGFVLGNSRLLAVKIGSGVGLITLALTWLYMDGLRIPGKPRKSTIAIAFAAVILLVPASMPLPAGQAEQRPSNTNKVCECLGEPVVKEATPMMNDLDMRKYCYGIPHSCRVEEGNRSAPEIS